jgi:hypothetical protein
MSHHEPPGPIDIQAALDDLPALGAEGAAAVEEWLVEDWAPKAEVVPAPMSFAVRVHVASR